MGKVVYEYGGKPMSANEFQKKIETVKEKADTLLNQEPVRFNGLPKCLPKQGVYVFSEGNKHLYVGRSNNVKRRLREHIMGDERKAPFAIRLAREAAGKQATYRKESSIATLMKIPKFEKSFKMNKEKIRKMKIRCIEESDPITQALLEICAAVVANSKYNSFDNH